MKAAIGWSEDPRRLNVTAALFHQAVTLVEMGELTREQAMIQLALGLAELTQRYFDQLVDLRNTMTPRYFVVGASPPEPKP